MPAESLPSANDTGNGEWDCSFRVYSHDDPESHEYGSEIILRNMEPRKKSKHVKPHTCNSSGAKSCESQQARSQCDDRSVPKLSTATEDSSTSYKKLFLKETFETARTEKTGRSSLGSWIKKKFLRFKGTETKPRQRKKTINDYKSTEKKNLRQVVVVGGSESVDTSVRDELSSWLGSMSVGDIRKVFGSGETSIEDIEDRTTNADEPLPKTFSELLENDSSASETRIDFRNRLNIYRARSSAYNTDEDVQTKVQRLNREASFMLMSFSIAPSESYSFSDDTESTTDDNLAEAIAKEMDLRRLIMGEAAEETAIGIKEITIPTPKSKKKDVLSPHHVNKCRGKNRPCHSTQLAKPTMPPRQMAGFFSDHENKGGPGAGCGASKDPTLPP